MQDILISKKQADSFKKHIGKSVEIKRNFFTQEGKKIDNQGILKKVARDEVQIITEKCKPGVAMAFPWSLIDSIKLLESDHVLIRRKVSFDVLI